MEVERMKGMGWRETDLHIVKHLTHCHLQFSISLSPPRVKFHAVTLENSLIVLQVIKHRVFIGPRILLVTYPREMKTCNQKIEIIQCPCTEE